MQLIPGVGMSAHVESCVLGSRDTSVVDVCCTARSVVAIGFIVSACVSVVVMVEEGVVATDGLPSICPTS